MILQTERLILRPWDKTDAENLYEYAKDERVGPVAGWPVHTGVENSREVIKNVLSVPETYAVCLKEDNKAIGSIGLMTGQKSNLDIAENEGELGFWLGVPFWGQGLIPEAINRMIIHAFDDLQLKKLWCGYFDGNEKSKKAQEKCGFTFHHTNKDVYWKPMNDVRTEHITSLEKQYARPLFNSEINSAIEIIWEVFSQFVAPDYSDHGIQTFKNSLYDRERNEKMKWYGAFDNGHLAGVLCMREMHHIGGFFVKAEYHKQGHGKRLFKRMTEDFDEKVFTVNASKYGVPIYKKLGFTETDSEQTVDGLRFTPMKYE